VENAKIKSEKTLAWTLEDRKRRGGGRGTLQNPNVGVGFRDRKNGEKNLWKE